MERHIVDISALKMQLTEKGLPIFSSSEIMNTIPMVVASLEKQEDRELQAKESQLKVYERGLMDILDIRCSAFKDSNNRKRIEEDLIKRMMTPDFKLQDLQMYSGLQEVYQNDYRFCGPNAQQNGKLRQLYVKQWKLQLELKKYKNIVERLKKVQVQIEKKWLGMFDDRSEYNNNKVDSWKNDQVCLMIEVNVIKLIITK